MFDNDLLDVENDASLYKILFILVVEWSYFDCLWWCTSCHREGDLLLLHKVKNMEVVLGLECWEECNGDQAGGRGDWRTVSGLTSWLVLASLEDN